MTATDRSAKAGIWSRIKSKLKPHKKPPEPESVTLPAFDTYDRETDRYMEIRYTRKDGD